MAVSDEILKAIKFAVDRKAVDCDRTYRTVVQSVTDKGYVILDESGAERTVKCCIPGATIKAGQPVWVTMPKGSVSGSHITGVA